MDCLHRLWHRLLFGSSPRTQQPRPAARPTAARPAAARPDSAAADAIASTIRQWVKPPPPRCQYRSQEEVELALLLPWLTDAERARFLDGRRSSVGKYHPWTPGYIVGEPWQQCQQWGPLVIPSPETMTIEGFCGLLTAEFTYGLSTICTPLALLSRPVRMLWLYRQGQRTGQVSAGLEQALGNRAQALN